MNLIIKILKFLGFGYKLAYINMNLYKTNFKKFLFKYKIDIFKSLIGKILNHKKNIQRLVINS